MSDPRKAQNLARIRDNQRRSRARRKEYLQELESKLRSCEQMGIEASAEIQSAARRVLDENRKLRALLYERGVSDAEIIMAMSTTSDRTYDHVSASSSLIAMLERRAGGNGPSCAMSPASTHSSMTAMSPHAPRVPPLSIPVPRSAALSSNDSPSPHSIVSGMDTPPPFHVSPFYGSPMTPVSDVKAEDIPPYNSYDQSFNNAWTYQSDAPYVTDRSSFYNNSSCVDAANIIRTMRAEVGTEFEHDSGSRAHGQTCYVNNSVVYNVMDKYANAQRVR